MSERCKVLTEVWAVGLLQHKAAATLRPKGAKKWPVLAEVARAGLTEGVPSDRSWGYRVIQDCQNHTASYKGREENKHLTLFPASHPLITSQCFQNPARSHKSYGIPNNDFTITCYEVKVSTCFLLLSMICSLESMSHKIKEQYFIHYCVSTTQNHSWHIGRIQ